MNEFSGIYEKTKREHIDTLLKEEKDREVREGVKALKDKINSTCFFLSDDFSVKLCASDDVYSPRIRNALPLKKEGFIKKDDDVFLRTVEECIKAYNKNFPSYSVKSIESVEKANKVFLSMVEYVEGIATLTRDLKMKEVENERL